MTVTHTYVSAAPPVSGKVDSAAWNAEHAVSISDSDISAAAAILGSKIVPASALASGALSSSDWIAFNAKQSALSFPLAANLGGTGIANAVGSTLTLGAATSITGGGTIALGTYTLTVPESLITAGRNVANIFTAAQTINANSNTALKVEQTGVKNNVLVVDTTNGLVGINTAPVTSQRLTVLNSGSGAGVVNIQSGEGESIRGILSIQHSNDSQAAFLGYKKSRGSVTSPASVNLGDYIGGFSTFAYNGTSYKQGAFFGVLVDGAVSGTNVPQAMTFWTGTNDSNILERARITSDGNLGVGISSPLALGHFVKTSATTGAVVEVQRIEARVTGTGAGGTGFGPAMTFWGETGTNTTYQQMAQIATPWTDATNATRTADMTFSVVNSATFEEVGRWKPGGLVVGAGKAGVDYTLTFDGETNDGVLTWKEDEDEFNFADRVTEPGTYAGIYVADATAAQSIPTGTTYTKCTLFTTNGLSSNCTADATNDKITITKAGKYYVCGTFSMKSGTNNVEFKGALFYDNTEQSNIHWERKIGTAGDVGSASFMGFITSAANKDIDFRVRHGDAGSIDFTLTYANLTAIYVGE